MNRLLTMAGHKLLYFFNCKISYRKKIQQAFCYSSSQISLASLVRKLEEPTRLLQVHAKLTVSTLLWDNVFLCNSLMNAYASFGHMTEARTVFSQILDKNLYSWTILVSGLTKNGFFIEAIEAFYGMLEFNEIRPNERTISSVLPAFGKLGDQLMGKSLHCYWIKQMFQDNVFVETGLVDMYSKLGCLRNAWLLFDRMLVRNVVSWNAIITCLSENGFGEESLQMFNRMRKEGFTYDIFTMMSLVSGCLSLEDFSVGSGVHGLTIVTGYDSDQRLKTSLIEMYTSVNFVNEAYCIFHEINNKDIVAWTMMLSALSKGDNWRLTIDHFNKMMGEASIMLDSVSLTTILSGCSSSGSLQQGQRVHGLVIKTGFQENNFVGSALIDMYANCANIQDSVRCFEWMGNKDLPCWNALISGYGMIGHGNNAVDVFLKMKSSGLKPNESTFVSILYACSHSGLVTKGLEIFDQMVEVWNVIPNLKHYACVVDLLGRAGRINDAYALVTKMELEPGPEIYSSLLTACKVHKNFELVFDISNRLLQLKPNDAGYYVLLSNIYAFAGNQSGVKMTRTFMKWCNMKKDPGFSLIEINGEIFKFMASQTDHPYYPEIKEFLEILILRIEAEGYEVDLNCVFQEVTDNVKRDILFHHSEKLAIAFGLMRVKSEREIIRITKNQRFCSDCHSACKFISRVYPRTLVIKDSNRFHIFREGKCSCREYW